MLLFVLTVLITVVVASAVVVYVAFPHRGHDVPTAPWLGQLMQRGVARLPTLDNRTSDDRRRDDVHVSAPLSR